MNIGTAIGARSVHAAGEQLERARQYLGTVRVNEVSASSISSVGVVGAMLTEARDTVKGALWTLFGDADKRARTIVSTLDDAVASLVHLRSTYPDAAGFVRSNHQIPSSRDGHLGLGLSDGEVQVKPVDFGHFDKIVAALRSGDELRSFGWR